MEKDYLEIEARLSHCCDRMPFLNNSVNWVTIEGKPYKCFLHLEDVRVENKLHTLLDQQGNEKSDVVSVLAILWEFYSDLYAEEAIRKTHLEILDFLNKMLSVLKIIRPVDKLVMPISSKEVENAIKRLRPGKAPGCDGLTSDFYKHFLEEMVPILTNVFNAVFENKSLSSS